MVDTNSKWPGLPSGEGRGGSLKGFLRGCLLRLCSGVVQGLRLRVS